MARELQQEIALLDLSLEHLDKLSTRVHHSIVFADEKFAEILHWHGGASLLLSFGATTIKGFSSFENGEASDTKATFFISSPLVDGVFDTLRDITSYSCFEVVTVVTSVHPAMQAVVNFRTPTDEVVVGIIAGLEKQVVRWMEEKSDGPCSCKLIYIPLVAAPILPNLFTTPSHSHLFPLIPTDLNLLSVRHKLTGQSGTELGFGHLPKEMQLRFKLLVSSLNSVAELLNVSDEIFALGTTSNIIANELAGLSWGKPRRKSTNRKASFLLIDRTLDIANVIHHGFESLLDRILGIMPKQHGHSVDVCIDMSPICNVISNPGYSCVAPGCLAHPEDSKYASLLNAFALLKQKEVTTELNRRLVEALEREGLLEKTDKSNSLDVMQHYINLFKNQPIAIKKHSSLLQSSLAILQTLRNGKTQSIEKLNAIEKSILQSFDDDGGGGGDDDCSGGDDDDCRGPNIILQVLKEFDGGGNGEEDGGSERLDDLLKLLMYVFALDDQERWSLSSKDETVLEVTLTKMFMKAKLSGKPQAAKLVEKCRSETECLSIVQYLIDRLKGLSVSKSHLQKYRSSVDWGTVTSPPGHRPIIKQVVQDVLDPNKLDLIDICHMSSTIGDFIKSGFGFFRGSSKPRPGDHPLLVVFIVGGVTMSEVKQVKDIVAKSKSQVQVLLGSTTVVTPIDILNLVLLHDNLQDS